MSSTECLSPAKSICERPIRRLLLVHTGEEPEVDLLDYAALLSAEETTIVAYPFDGVLRSMSATARARFEVNGAAAPILRALPELDLDWVFNAARDADLLVMRRAGALGTSHALTRQVLSKAPCSVCLAPGKSPSRIERVLVGVALDEDSRVVLERAAALCRSVGADELIVAHCCSPDIYLDLDESQWEQFRSERMLELYRFMASSALGGVSCTPVIQDGTEPQRALARAARERFADLIVAGRRNGLTPRTAAGLVSECSLPVVQVLLASPPHGFRAKLRRLFSNPEPKFG
jgi:nucleotide-binding universal stress UspA family protein